MIAINTINELKFHATWDPAYATKPVQAIAKMVSPEFREKMRKQKKSADKLMLKKMQKRLPARTADYTRHERGKAVHFASQT